MEVGVWKGLCWRECFRGQQRGVVRAGEEEEEEEEEEGRR